MEGLYKGLVHIKNFLYDRRLLRSAELPIPVLSIGNLTVGGTGKTPLTDFCLQHYQKRGLRVGVVSRNYRAQVKTMAEVYLDQPEAALYFGDEPILLKERNPQVKVYVGPRKYQTAQYAYSKDKLQLILVDDGFQHRRLHRDVDLVIVDATESLDNFRCLPWGRGREPLSSLKRATAVLVTKTNLTTDEKVQAVVSRLRQEFDGLIFSFSYEVLRLQNPRNLDTLRPGSCDGMRSYLVSGIAKPEAFVKSLSNFSLNILKHHEFADHHPYSQTDIDCLVEAWTNLDKPTLITTEKDYVKLRGLWPEEVPLWVAPLEVRLNAQEELFYEVLDQAIC